MSDLVELRTVVESSFAPIESKPGDYVELVDETRPDGAVVLRREDGSPFIWMSRAAFESFEAFKKGGAE